MSGWQNKPIGEVFRVVNGGTPKTGVSTYWGGDHSWITPAEMGSLESPYLSSSRRTLTDEGLRVGAELVPPNSIILSSRAPIGHLVINAIPMAFNQGCKGLVPSPGIDAKFAYYFLLANVSLLESLGTGATFKELSGGKLKEVEFRFPSVAEQQRIVAILDEAFAGIATAKANAESSLQNAREVFDNYLSTVFSTHCDEWPIQPLISLCGLFVDSAHRTPKYQAAGIPALRPRDVVNGSLDMSRAARVSIEEYEIQSKRHKPSAGDIVYSRELSLGWAARLPEEPRVCLSQGMCLFRPLPEVDSDYLLYALNGPFGREQAMKAAVGTAHPHINLGDIKSYSFPLPPQDVQKKTVGEVQAIDSETQRLESIYTRKLTALDELKQSLLHQAFSGQL